MEVCPGSRAGRRLVTSASIALVLGGRAPAYLRNRDQVPADDVRELALDVLRHRVVLDPDTVIAGVLRAPMSGCLRSPWPVRTRRCEQMERKLGCGRPRR